MRQELFKRGVISPREFEAQVREQAVLSQLREGMVDPIGEEPAEVWKERNEVIRTYLTDLYFANNLPLEILEELIRKTLVESDAEEEILESFNPELATQEMLFEQGQRIKSLPQELYQKYRPRLQEIKVVLIKSMISDQLAYVHLAKEWLKLDDLIEIRKHKIGTGKIGGKAAGMLLAQRILNQVADQDILDHLHIPESYFLAADIMYAFMQQNDLMVYGAQKYKTEDEIRNDYPKIVKDFEQGVFPPDVVEELQTLLAGLENKPLIVRSSSLLEDNFGMAFAGKYDSHFCPNQGTPEKNLKFLLNAITRVYASALNPDALLYRRSKGLQDYDERIAILIQPVQGKIHGDYFFPDGAGVAFSQNLFRWSPLIQKEGGFTRLVWGLGTRAVDRVGNDYPRLVALSHPLLHSSPDPKMIHNYSQRYVDTINLKTNQMESVPSESLFDHQSPILRYVAQTYQDGYLSAIRSSLVGKRKKEKLVITFDELIRRTSFAEHMRRILRILEESYQMPVDLEYTVEIVNPLTTTPSARITLLQCRPQSQLMENNYSIPRNLTPEDLVFKTSGIVPQGRVENIDTVLFVPPEGYYSIKTQPERNALYRAVGKLNKLLKDHIFICVGPGRWGTVNPDLGLKVGYSDIYNCRALVELSGKGVGPAPEPSFGTHFFQDLLESQIYPLAISFDQEDTVFNMDFFFNTPNRLKEISPEDSGLENCLKIIHVRDFAPEYTLELTTDGNQGLAAAYFTKKEEDEE